MKNRENLYMVDIETSGVVKDRDAIMEVACVEIAFRNGFWHPTGKKFHKVLHFDGKPETPFQKQHQKDLFKLCNETDPSENYEKLSEELKHFIHAEEKHIVVNGEHGRDYNSHVMVMPEIVTPKLFIGWNASNFDLEFLFKKKILTPSYYEVVGNKEELRGDVHYRVYEQTGALQVICDITGLNRKTIEVLAMDMNPTGITLPEGKDHDALFDCYKQIIMQNGLIAIGRSGIKK